jgi:hypothetical protein
VDKFTASSRYILQDVFTGNSSFRELLNMSWEAVITGVGLLFAGMAYIFRLEQKLAVQDERHDGLKDLIESRFDGMDNRLERIEDKIDGRR